MSQEHPPKPDITTKPIDEVFKYAESVIKREGEPQIYQHGVYRIPNTDLVMKFTTMTPPVWDMETSLNVSHSITVERLIHSNPSDLQTAPSTELYSLIVDDDGTAKEENRFGYEEVMENIYDQGIVEIENIPGIPEVALSEEAKKLKDDVDQDYTFERLEENQLGLNVVSDQRVNDLIARFMFLLQLPKVRGIDIDVEELLCDSKIPRPSSQITDETSHNLKKFIEKHATQRTTRVADVDQDDQSITVRAVVGAENIPHEVSLSISEKGDQIGSSGTVYFTTNDEWVFFSGNKPHEYERTHRAVFEYDLQSDSFTTGVTREEMESIMDYNRHVRANEEEDRRNGGNIATPDEIRAGVNVLRKLAEGGAE